METQHLAHRLAACRNTGVWLQSLADDVLGDMLAGTAAAQGNVHPRTSGFGGTTTQLQWGETRIFCKSVPLTLVELEAANLYSTANLFKLPVYYQYGIGSVGFGAWRELAAHRLTTQWVQNGQHDQFPLLFHWRVLTRPQAVVADEEAYGYLQHPAAQGQDETAIRERLDAIRDSRADLLLFTECLPFTLSAWLQQQLLAGPAAAEAAIHRVEACALQAFQFMQRQQFLHFDAHLDNVVTDGARLYFADLGLAVHPSFQLSAEELLFLQRHAGYDAARFSSSLVQNLCRAVPGEDRWQDKWERVATTPGLLPGAAVSALHRSAPAAAGISRFAHDLINRDRHALFGGSWVPRVAEVS